MKFDLVIMGEGIGYVIEDCIDYMFYILVVEVGIGFCQMIDQFGFDYVMFLCLFDKIVLRQRVC